METMRRVRKNFAKNVEVVKKPHLIEMQRISYEKFLQRDVEPDQRHDVGLQAIYKNVFPILDFNGVCSLEFVKYDFGEPKYSAAKVHRLLFDVPNVLHSGILIDIIGD